MKILLLLLLMAGISVTSCAQSFGQNYQLQNAKSGASVGFFKTHALLSEPSEAQVYFSLFWEFSTFRFGSEDVGLPARINIHKETIELQFEGEMREIQLSRLEDFTVHVEGVSRRFITLPDYYDPGVYEVLFTSEKVSLYRRFFTELYPATYLEAFDVGDKYVNLKVDKQIVIVLDGVSTVLPRSENKILEIFPEPNQIKEYLKVNNLSPRKEEDLVVTLNHFFADGNP